MSIISGKQTDQSHEARNVGTILCAAQNREIALNAPNCPIYSYQLISSVLHFYGLLIENERDYIVSVMANDLRNACCV